MPSIFNSLSDIFGSVIAKIIYFVPVLLISFPVHELAHAGVAYLLGDRTARDAGRLTLNPLKHLDPLGTVLILIAGIGWAKPVPINPNNFKNRREGMALTAIAGPLANFLLALLSMVLLRIFSVTAVPQYFLELLYWMVFLNIGLAIFNLIPISPLDGSRILMLFLPEKAEFWFYSHEGMIASVFFVAILLFPGFLSGPLNTLIQNVYSNFSSLVELIPV